MSLEITEIPSLSPNFDVERKVKFDFTRKLTGIDLGLELLYTDSQGRHIGNPRLLRKPQRALKELQKRVFQRPKEGKIEPELGSICE